MLHYDRERVRQAQSEPLNLNAYHNGLKWPESQKVSTHEVLNTVFSWWRNSHRTAWTKANFRHSPPMLRVLDNHPRETMNPWSQTGNEWGTKHRARCSPASAVDEYTELHRKGAWNEHLVKGPQCFTWPSDHPTTLGVRPFDLGIRVGWSPLRNHGSRRTTDDVDMRKWTSSTVMNSAHCFFFPILLPPE